MEVGVNGAGIICCLDGGAASCVGGGNAVGGPVGKEPADDGGGPLPAC